jgi:hypothetical protein
MNLDTASVNGTTATPTVEPDSSKTDDIDVDLATLYAGFSTGHGQTTPTPTPLPSGEPYVLADVLDETVAALRRFVHFTSDEQAWAVALWIAHTHLIENFDFSARLAIRAPSKQSGKTRLMEVIKELVSNGWHVVGPSAPVLFRSIEKNQPTILLDEADRLFERRAEDMGDVLQLLNTGHARGSTVPRMVPIAGKWEVQDFPAFAAIALAGIGNDWPDTVLDRSIIIKMERMVHGDTPVERLRREGKAELHDLSVKLNDSLQCVTEYRYIGLPNQLNDRAQDGWEPLFAIAETAGKHWPKRARQAAINLYGAGLGTSEERPELIALRDVRAVFEHEGDPAFLTSQLCLFGLLSIKESPWNDGPRILTYHKLGRMLRKFDIESHQPEKGGQRGYYLVDIERHWGRLRDSDESLAHLVTSVSNPEMTVTHDDD